MRRAVLQAVITVVTSVLICLSPNKTTQAQTYPNRPIHFVVPVLAGGPNDFVARLFADRLSKSMGQPVIVENRPGAGGNLGTEYVSKQPADGYTILASAMSHVISPNFVAKLNFDPIKDFTPITTTVSTTFVLVVNPEVPATDIKEFIALARSKPGILNYASAGVGTPHQLATELLKSMTGTNMVHVAYKGANEIIPALLSHQVDFTIIATFGVLPHIKSGKLRAIAVASPMPTPLLPGIPTIADALPLPGYAVDVWQGVLGPAGIPKEIVSRLNREMTSVLNDRENAEKLLALGLQPAPSTPERFGEIMQTDLAKWAAVVKSAGIGKH